MDNVVTSVETESSNTNRLIALHAVYLQFRDLSGRCSVLRIIIVDNFPHTLLLAHRMLQTAHYILLNQECVSPDELHSLLCSVYRVVPESGIFVEIVDGANKMCLNPKKNFSSFISSTLINMAESIDINSPSYSFASTHMGMTKDSWANEIGVLGCKSLKEYIQKSYGLYPPDLPVRRLIAKYSRMLKKFNYICQNTIGPYIPIGYVR